MEDTFDGSLPAFLAAFTTRKSLSEKDIAEIQRMIDRCQMSSAKCVSTTRKSLSEKDIAEIQRMIDRCGKE